MSSTAPPKDALHHTHHRPEILRDAATIMDTMKIEESMTPKEVEHLAQCYKEKTCDSTVLDILKKYEGANGTLEMEDLRVVLDGSKVVCDLRKVVEQYDTNGDGKLSPEELKTLSKDYEQNKNTELLSRWDLNKDGKIDEAELSVLVNDVISTDTNLRYTGYTFMLANMLRSGVRYSAYMSDVGESFRPIINKRLVQLTYAISWSYVIGDVCWEGYKAKYHRNEKSKEVAELMVERALFQSIASMIIPMTLIHTLVSVSQKIFARYPNIKPVYKRWGPTMSGLLLIPFLPFMIDKPVEHALEYGKEVIHERWGEKHEATHGDKE